MSVAANAVANVIDGKIVASVEIAATPDAVFRAMSSAEICSWWGSEDTYRVVNWVGDVRAGGKWQADTRAFDGERAMIVRGEYITVDPPRLLVFTWCPAWENFAETTVRYELTPTPLGTRLDVVHSGFADAAARQDHAEGWKRVLAWLVEHF
jgi:uncharacterized protein YndB with AHSA1/START domain